MESAIAGYTTPDAVFEVQKVYTLLTATAYFVQVWDWLAHLPQEISLVLRSRSSTAQRTATRRVASLTNLFLVSRYLTLAWSTFVVASWASSAQHPIVCTWTKYYTYAYTVLSLASHSVMVTRMHSLYDRSQRVLVIMLSLSVVDFAVQMSANHLVTSVRLYIPTPGISTCLILPTTPLYSLVFISPTLLHHLILAMTLYKSISHIRITKAAGITSIMEVVQRDHILYTLAICLINFSNLVLVLAGPKEWPYKLVNQLPAAVFTQLFLSRIVFSMHSRITTQKPTLAPQVHSARFISSSSSSSSPRLGTRHNDPITPPQFSPTALTLRDNSVDSALFWNNDGRGGGITDLEKIGHGRKRSSLATTLRSPGNESTFNEKVVSLPGFYKKGANEGEDEDTPRAPSKPFWKKYTLAATSSPSPSSLSFAGTGASTPVLKFSSASDKTLAARIIETHELSSYTLPSPRLPQQNQHTSSTLNRLDMSAAASSTLNIRGRRDADTDTEKDEISVSPTTLVHPPVRPALERRSTGSFGLGIGEVTHGQKEHDDVLKEAQEDKQDEDEEEEQGARPRGSIASSIDENMKYIDWEAPPAWGTPPLTSPRGSPLQFTERRLSNSIARLSFNLPTTTVPSSAASHPAAENVARSTSPTVSLSAAGRRGSQGASRHQNAGRRSQTYASVISFDEAAEGEDEDDKTAK